MKREKIISNDQDIDFKVDILKFDLPLYEKNYDCRRGGGITA